MPGKGSVFTSEAPTGATLSVFEALFVFGEAGATNTEWSKRANKPTTTFDRIRKALTKDNLVEKHGKGRGARYHLTEKGRAYSHHPHDTPNGSEGRGHDHYHHPPHSLRSGGDGSDGGDPLTDTEQPLPTDRVSI